MRIINSYYNSIVAFPIRDPADLLQYPHSANVVNLARHESV